MQELISCKPCDHDTQLLLGPLMLLGSWSLLSLTLTEVGRQGSALGLTSIPSCEVAPRPQVGSRSGWCQRAHCHCQSLAGSTHWALFQQGNSGTFSWLPEPCSHEHGVMGRTQTEPLPSSIQIREGYASTYEGNLLRNPGSSPVLESAMPQIQITK